MYLHDLQTGKGLPGRINYGDRGQEECGLGDWHSVDREVGRNKRMVFAGMCFTP